MKLRLDVLPKAQLKLWFMLKGLPDIFTLYGGTAVALHLGHRKSVDFDFFSAEPLDKKQLLDSLPFISKAHLVQPEINTLDCLVEIGKSQVKLQFLTGLKTRQGRVEEPTLCPDNGIYIASLRDLLATKLNTIQMRAEIKDYIDIDAMLSYGLSLEDGLGCARAIYGPMFDVGTSLRALCSYNEGNLAELPAKIKSRLTKSVLIINTVKKVKLNKRTI